MRSRCGGSNGCSTLLLSTAPIVSLCDDCVGVIDDGMDPDSLSVNTDDDDVIVTDPRSSFRCNR